MTKRKGERMLDILKENYQDSETDLALYVGAHKYEDVPGMQQVLWYVKGAPDELGAVIAHTMEKRMSLRAAMVAALNKYLVKRYGREQVMEILRVIELYKESTNYSKDKSNSKDKPNEA